MPACRGLRPGDRVRASRKRGDLSKHRETIGATSGWYGGVHLPRQHHGGVHARARSRRALGQVCAGQLHDGDGEGRCSACAQDLSTRRRRPAFADGTMRVLHQGTQISVSVARTWSKPSVAEPIGPLPSTQGVSLGTPRWGSSDSASNADIPIVRPHVALGLSKVQAWFED